MSWTAISIILFLILGVPVMGAVTVFILDRMKENLQREISDLEKKIDGLVDKEAIAILRQMIKEREIQLQNI